MILKLLEEIDPILRQKSEKITSFKSGILNSVHELEQLISNLAQTAKHHAAVGVSAVQCGILKQVCLVSADGKNFTALINPEILESKGEQASVEGCLSFKKGTQCIVVRPEELLIQYQDIYGNLKRITCKGLLAAVASHELDHCQGVLMTDRAIQVLDRSRDDVYFNVGEQK